MKFFYKLLILLSIPALLLNCTKTGQTHKILTQDNFPKPPVIAAIPDTFREFGNVRIDNYFWLKDKTNPGVISYLEEENKYCDTVMAHTKGLQVTLFNEFKSRIKEDDQSVPALDNGYYYYSRTIKDKQYVVHCRKKGDTTAVEEVLFDVNKMAEGRNAFMFAGYAVSPDNHTAAYIFNTTGSYAEYELKIKDLSSGNDLEDHIIGISSAAWAKDSKTLFYTRISPSLRPYQVFRHLMGDNRPDKLVFQENDELFDLDLSTSATRDYIFITSGSFNTTEVRMIPADNPGVEPRIFMPRKDNVEYEIDHHKTCFYVRYKTPEVKNAMIYQAPLTGFGDMKNWKVIVPHDPKVKIQGFSVYNTFMGLFVRADGLNQIRILTYGSGETKEVTFPEPVYTVFPIPIPEYGTTKFRYVYSSLNRPQTTYDYDTEKNTSIILKVQEVPGGFNSDNYTVERLWANAPDGTKVPMAIVYRKGLEKNGKNPALLYAYGSYGINTDANFGSSAFSLVDRGFVYGIAQIRGGSEMGEQWYEDGKMMKKMNTFTDFIACAEKLVNDRYTSPALLGIRGGSAGGLLMGAVVNLRPDLVNVVLAQVPFVDVVNTMLDKTLPLTTQEYEQWGNPNEEAAYRYILSYSPYDNVKPETYPNILATGGLNDSQVSFHEPAKWVAKLRSMKTGNNIILLKTNMESGHGGATGRYDNLKELAFYYAFLLDRMGMAGN
jgi:oligopeptidase B